MGKAPRVSSQGQRRLFFNHTDQVTHPGPLQFFVNHQIYEIQFPAHLPPQTCELPPNLNYLQLVSHEHDPDYPP